MEPGTWVALGLGVVGFVISLLTRHDAKERAKQERTDAGQRAQQEHDDEIERRWLQEKRVVYAQMQAALTASVAASDAANMAYIFSDKPDTVTPEIERLLDAAQVARKGVRNAQAELALLCPAPVYDAVGDAARAAAELQLSFKHFPDDDRYIATYQVAQDFLGRALNAMRSDLGADPVTLGWRWTPRREDPVVLACEEALGHIKAGKPATSTTP
jgi:hypothetical protein